MIYKKYIQRRDTNKLLRNQSLFSNRHKTPMLKQSNGQEIKTNPLKNNASLLSKT